MEKQKVTAGKHIILDQVTLVPVLRTTVCGYNGKHGITGFGSKEVIGVVVVSPAGIRAIDISGEEVPVKEYLRLMPDLAEVLEIS